MLASELFISKLLSILLFLSLFALGYIQYNDLSILRECTESNILQRNSRLLSFLQEYIQFFALVRIRLVTFRKECIQFEILLLRFPFEQRMVDILNQNMPEGIERIRLLNNEEVVGVGFFRKGEWFVGYLRIF